MIQNLYKIFAKGLDFPLYVAANTQQEAVDKAATAYDTEDKYKFIVEYIAEVLT